MVFLPEQADRTLGLDLPVVCGDGQTLQGLEYNTQRDAFCGLGHQLIVTRCGALQGVSAVKIVDLTTLLVGVLTGPVGAGVGACDQSLIHRDQVGRSE